MSRPFNGASQPQFVSSTTAAIAPGRAARPVSTTHGAGLSPLTRPPIEPVSDATSCHLLAPKTATTAPSRSSSAPVLTTTAADGTAPPLLTLAPHQSGAQDRLMSRAPMTLEAVPEADDGTCHRQSPGAPSSDVRSPPQQVQRPQEQRQQPSAATSSSPPDRSLPTKDVQESNIDDVYIQFILYCNPFIPADIDTGELRKGFNNPPRSDGKTFSPWALFGLLQRLDKKEIKTWAHLVMELGVEPPDPEKNQSTQKVQQYAVRLKRWLHAFHIDAFFNYLGSNPGAYYTEIPQTEAEMAETTREGILPEEDLALRALLPGWRPKRGRRKAEENDGDPESGTDAKTPGRRLQRTTGPSQYSAAATPQASSALSWSAMTPNTSTSDPWTAAHIAIASKSSTANPTTQPAGSASSGARVWPLSTQPGPQPADFNVLAHPQSAATPHVPFSASFATTFGADDPPSALGPVSAGSVVLATPLGKSPRVRKRHAPAISSAWNSGGTPGGKIRGRPPSNRNIQDGPFSTFPVNPSAARPSPGLTTPSTPAMRRSPLQVSTNSPPDLPRSTSDSSVRSNINDVLHGDTHSRSPNPSATGGPDPANMPIYTSNTSDPSGTVIRKPSKLQLQVPEHAGGPVRLATPPRVLLNGEERQPQQTGSQSTHEVNLDADEELDDNDDDEEMIDIAEGDGESGQQVDWKRRAMILQRQVRAKQAQIDAMRRRVIDACYLER